MVSQKGRGHPKNFTHKPPLDPPLNCTLHNVAHPVADFLNGEDVYIKQPVGYKSEGKEHLVCRLKKGI